MKFWIKFLFYSSRAFKNLLLALGKVSYNLLLLLGAAVLLPKWLLQKKYRGSFKQRLGLELPKRSQKKSIWIHMVSMGETKAMLPIFHQLRSHYPKTPIYLTSTTKTGHEEAKRSMLGAKGYFYLPLDFSWTMQNLARRINPKLLILSEGDFWPNLIEAAKKKGKVLVLSGKISERSTSRFQVFPFLSRSMFRSIDQFCVQTERIKNRFEKIGVESSKIQTTGNLKLAILPNPSIEILIQKYNLNKEDCFVTIASTHPKEEELLLSTEVLRNYTLLLAPRHPERFNEVKKIASKYPNVILIEEMGILSSCFAISQFAIIGGSFIPHIGGHNIFEPIQANIPVLFGPYMESQKDLTELVLNAHVGIQTSSIEHGIQTLLEDFTFYKTNAEDLSKAGAEILKKNWDVLENLLNPLMGKKN